MKGLAAQIMSSATTLDKKKSEPRTARKLRNLSYDIRQQEEAERAYALLVKMLNDTALRTPYPGLKAAMCDLADAVGEPRPGPEAFSEP